MKTLLTMLVLIAVAFPCAAFDLGPAAPTKPAEQHSPPPVNPQVLRQGGDSILDAVAVTLPVSNLVGTTAGYTDDYDEVCPYSQSTSADVVYTFTPDGSHSLTVDMLGSAYDTKIYIYDVDLNLVACNDDFHPDYTSKLENVPVVGGTIYYLVIDGYGGDAGEGISSNSGLMIARPWAYSRT